MKQKISVFIIVCFTSLPVLAQLHKGNMMFGGYVGIAVVEPAAKFSGPGNTNQQTLRIFEIQTGLKIGWFVKNNLVVGISPSIRYHHQSYEPDAFLLENKDHVFTFMAGLFAYLYLADAKTSFKPYVFSSLKAGNYSLVNQSITRGGTTPATFYTQTLDYKASGPSWEVEAGPGVTWFFNKTIGLDLMMTYKYHHNTTQINSDRVKKFDAATSSITVHSSSSGSDVVSGLNINLGLSVFLEKLEMKFKKKH